MQIRQIGDSVLHSIPRAVDFESDGKKVQHDYEILERDLHKFAGVGIAANQCAEIKEPLQMMIVGTSLPQVRESAKLRYPDQEIPNETLMVNPKIIAYQGDVYYPEMGEGCLSVYGSLRAKMPRHSEVVLEYCDIEGICFEKIFSGFIAHIIQHEVDHLKGLVYLQKAFEEYSGDELELILKLVKDTIDSQGKALERPDSLKPVLIFDRKDDKLIYDKTQLIDELQKLATETLLGLKRYLKLKQA